MDAVLSCGRALHPGHCVAQVINAKKKRKKSRAPPGEGGPAIDPSTSHAKQPRTPEPHSPGDAAFACSYGPLRILVVGLAAHHVTRMLLKHGHTCLDICFWADI